MKRECAKRWKEAGSKNGHVSHKDACKHTKRKKNCRGAINTTDTKNKNKHKQITS